jgi:hypothetical protein
LVSTPLDIFPEICEMNEGFILIESGFLPFIFAMLKGTTIVFLFFVPLIILHDFHAFAV